MILGAVHRSPGCGNPQKTSARRPSDEGAVRPVIGSNGFPFLQMRSIGSHSTSGREKEGNEERTGRDPNLWLGELMPHLQIERNQLLALTPTYLGSMMMIIVIIIITYFV